MSAYIDVVAAFRLLTNTVHAESGRCCANVRDGAPQCCYQIADGEDLTFTATEIGLLGLKRGFVQREDGMFVFDRDWWTPEILADGLHDGWLAMTLECAAHPTRPLIVDGIVTGVVVIDDCNGLLALEKYRQNKELLLRLWQEAVTLTGVKTYYVTYGIRPGWVLL